MHQTYIQNRVFSLSSRQNKQSKKIAERLMDTESVKCTLSDEMLRIKQTNENKYYILQNYNFLGHGTKPTKLHTVHHIN